MEPFSLLTILSSLIPSLGYAFKRIVDYKTGGATPSNATEAAAQSDADVRKLEAIASIDGATGASQWVVNVRAMQRPVVVFITLTSWLAMTIAGMGGAHIDMQVYVIVANTASSVMFYLFGDRSLMYSLQKLNLKLTGGK